MSDNTLVNLVPGGADKFVDYEDRTDYIRLVRNCRMAEGKQQVQLSTRHLSEVVTFSVRMQSSSWFGRDSSLRKISLTLRIVINVPTRALLAVETKGLSFLWLSHVNNKSNVYSHRVELWPKIFKNVVLKDSALFSHCCVQKITCLKLFRCNDSFYPF